MLRSLYLRAKRPLQQQLRKMNETALERTEQSLKHQEDGRKLLQQDFLSNIYGPGFHRRREQIHSSLQVEKSLERRKDSLQTALLVSSSFPTQETPDELNPLTTENFQTGGNFPATCSFSAEGQIGDYGCSLEVDTNGNASFEMSETGAAKQFAETQTSEKLQSADHHITLTKDEITGVERAADGTVTEYQATDACQSHFICAFVFFPISQDLQGHRSSKTAIGCQQALISFIFLTSGLELQVAIYR